MSVGSRLGAMSISRFRLTREQAAPCWLAALLVIAILTPGAARGESTVSLGGFTLVNKGLVAFGRLPADLRDKLGETFGSGSGMAVDPKSWSRDGASYRGMIYLLPDRGYNITGTIDYRSRLNKLSIVFTPADDPATLAPAQ